MVENLVRSFFKRNKTQVRIWFALMTFFLILGLLIEYLPTNNFTDFLVILVFLIQFPVFIWQIPIFLGGWVRTVSASEIFFANSLSILSFIVWNYILAYLFVKL